MLYITIIFILLSYAVFMGNKIENILFFVKPFLMIGIIPVVFYLINSFGIAHYLKYFYYAGLSLVAYLFLLFIVFIGNNEMLYYIMSLDNNLTITINEYSEMRVLFKTYVFVIPLILYIIIFKNNYIYRIPLLAIIILSVFLSKTYGLLLSLIVVYILYLLIRKNYKVILSIFIITMLSFSMLYSNNLLDFDSILKENKQRSLDIKVDQINSAIEMIEGNILFGKGLGYEFLRFDEREGNSIILEVFPAMILSVGGLVGSLLILYLYFPMFFYLYHKKINKVYLWLWLSQISILIASFANPYIWSGGVGMFFTLFSVSLYFIDKTKIMRIDI